MGPTTCYLGCKAKFISEPTCHFTGSATATTTASLSSLSLPIPSSTQGSELRLMDWIKVSFTEGHELDRKWKVPKEMIGRRLSQAEAKEVVG